MNAVRCMTIAQFASMLGVQRREVRRLLRAGLLGPRLVSDDYTRARLLMDLEAAGMTLDELRKLAGAPTSHRTAAEASRSMSGLLDAALPLLASRLERLRRTREDIIRTCEALHRCRGCYKSFDALSCRSCQAMPTDPPRILDSFYLPR